LTPSPLNVSLSSELLEKLFPHRVFGRGLLAGQDCRSHGVTVSIVRRLVGKLDPEAHRQRQEEIARHIDQGTFILARERSNAGKGQTDQSKATF